MHKFLLPLSLACVLVACQTSEAPTSENELEFSVDFEKFTLDNGLEVIFHIDRSDPVVAVALTAHVGSAREKAGRTGFAHLFEHLLFLESENLGKGGLDKLSARVGGSGANGSTSTDRTNYFQTVPNDALEKMLWAEADKLGWFINTVTYPVLAKEKQVVKNEKRQVVDNRPYGHTNYVIDSHLYPEDHPYSWQVIGSLEDVENATVEDVKEFFRRWYVPNNVTLTVAGDFDTDQAKEWVEKYFGEIPRGQEVETMEPRAVVLTATELFFHEDNFARLPELNMAWPSVPLYHPDSYALSVLSQYLSQGKEAPLYQVLVEEEQLSSGVRMSSRSQELAGKVQIGVRAFAGKDLDDVRTAIESGLARFEAEGISQQDLDRILAGNETRFYNGLSSVLGKGFQLAQYNIFAGDPGFIAQDIENRLSVTTADVMRVYETYLKGKSYIATSFVPKGQAGLALEGSEVAQVVEEAIVQGAEEQFDASVAAEFERTPSAFDRTVEPPYGAVPQVKVPDVWEQELSNGLALYGVESQEVPLVQFNLVMEGGALMEAAEKSGTANLLAQLMTKGTANRTPAELEAAIQQLGASINIGAGRESITLSATTLKRNYQATLDLAIEMLLQPRWDATEFDLLKQQVQSQYSQQQGNPNAIASNAFNALVYGAEHPRARNLIGDEATLAAITIEDLKGFYQNNLSPSISRMLIVGDITQSEVISSLDGLESQWARQEVDLPEEAQPQAPKQGQVYFYDVPNAKQSVLRIGRPALAATDEDYYPATVMNYILGGGGFASQLTQELRENKGYTYGVRSFFSGTEAVGTFTISSGVRTNITLEATQAVKEILENYGPGFSTQDLETTKGFLIKSNARAFETAGAKLRMLSEISAYGRPYDYVKDQEQIVQEITQERIRELAAKYVNPDEMIWLVVGDAKTQLPRMRELGYGEPILINVESEMQ